MKKIILAVVLSMISSLSMAQSTETSWDYILICTDIKTDKKVLEEKSTRGPSYDRMPAIIIVDPESNNYVYIFSVGADVICKYMSKETYEKRR